MPWALCAKLIDASGTNARALPRRHAPIHSNVSFILCAALKLQRATPPSRAKRKRTASNLFSSSPEKAQPAKIKRKTARQKADFAPHPPERYHTRTMRVDHHARVPPPPPPRPPLTHARFNSTAPPTRLVRATARHGGVCAHNALTPIPTRRPHIYVHRPLHPALLLYGIIPHPHKYPLPTQHPVQLSSRPHCPSSPPPVRVITASYSFRPSPPFTSLRTLSPPSCPHPSCCTPSVLVSPPTPLLYIQHPVLPMLHTGGYSDSPRHVRDFSHSHSQLYRSDMSQLPYHHHHHNQPQHPQMPDARYLPRARPRGDDGRFVPRAEDQLPADNHDRKVCGWCGRCQTSQWRVGPTTGSLGKFHFFCFCFRFCGPL